jgi:MarR family transcriptional regulator, 2-MHQ and catechol-resistance regulon repressor
MSSLHSSPVEPTNFFPLMRELVRTYEAFYRSNVLHLAPMGLSIDQFDVVAILGNTPGMKVRQIKEKSLIQPKSLLQVIDELEQSGFVEKEPLLPNQPAISMVVKLSNKGEKLFAECFPAHIEYLRSMFSQLEPAEIQLLQVFLGRLKRAFQEKEI